MVSISMSFVVFLGVFIGCAYGYNVNNVCPTLQDYATVRTNKRCWYNPDVDAKTSDIAERYGYRMENHKVTTPDGYILTLNRLVPLEGTPGKLPILLQHGICNNAEFWLMHGNSSIPIYLSNKGFDVWLSNSRGTEPSMRHVRMSSLDPEFWDFSFHEMAVFDVPSCLDYIRKKVGKRKITFIGHSMGGTIQFVYASMMPQHARENVNAIISLAPVVYTKHMKTRITVLAPHTNFIENELQMIEFHGSGMYPNVKKNVGKICTTYPYIYFCNQIIEAVSGRSEANFEAENLPMLFKRYPASFSLKTLAHYGQEIFSGGLFQMYDYGVQKNLRRYNSATPQKYDIKKIDIPVYILYGEADLLSVPEDNINMFNDLETKEKYLIPFRGGNNTIEFTHEDFLQSKSMMDLNECLANLLKSIKEREKNNVYIKKKR